MIKKMVDYFYITEVRSKAFIFNSEEGYSQKKTFLGKVFYVFLSPEHFKSRLDDFPEIQLNTEVNGKWVN